jgi:hypothetical protein
MAKKKVKRPRRRNWKIEVFRSFAEADEADRKYWLSKTPAQRMRALEHLRQMNYGYGPGKPPLKFERIVRVIKLGEQ